MHSNHEQAFEDEMEHCLVGRYTRPCTATRTAKASDRPRLMPSSTDTECRPPAQLDNYRQHARSLRVGGHLIVGRSFQLYRPGSELPVRRRCGIVRPRSHRQRVAINNAAIANTRERTVNITPWAWSVCPLTLSKSRFSSLTAPTTTFDGK